MCLWLVNFFIAVDQITLAGAFATFYFSSNRPRQRRNAMGYCCGISLLLSTCGTALLYHMGSLAFGSLLIALLSFLRFCLMRLERKLKTASANGSEIAKFFLRCLCCCLWCLEKFLRFLNRNAYIMVSWHF